MQDFCQGGEIGLGETAQSVALYSYIYKLMFSVSNFRGVICQGGICQGGISRGPLPLYKTL